jgi:hypothetical protein
MKGVFNKYRMPETGRSPGKGSAGFFPVRIQGINTKARFTGFERIKAGQAWRSLLSDFPR